MHSKLSTNLTVLALLMALLPAAGLAAEEAPEEFPATNESLAIIQQFDQDYDQWQATQVKRAAVSHGNGEAVKVVIHKKTQSMNVTVNGKPLFSTMVTTGMAGKTTPSGTWHAGGIERVHMSREYHAPLPWAVRITGGYFIHGATEGALVYMKKKIPHSHGCVRVPPVFARELYDLVLQAGTSNTTIIVTQ
jgi:lipoprotein-anchoring transpeptidase ErfK/SrfK